MSRKRFILKSGFTIVELLIVIVVIAILAAITVIAYNGITTKAENTKTVNSVSEYIKVLQAYAAENGSYPISTNTCLLQSAGACGNMSQTGSVCFGMGTAAYKQSFVDALSTVATSIPLPSTQTMNCNGAQYGGAFYHSVNGTTSTHIIYFLKGDPDCSLAGGSTVSKTHQDDTTRCLVYLPDL